MELLIFILSCLVVPLVYFIIIQPKTFQGVQLKDQKQTAQVPQALQGQQINEMQQINQVQQINQIQQAVNYDIYRLSPRERLLYTSIAAVVIFAVSYLFFNSFLISLCFCPVSLFYLSIKRKELIKKRKNELNLQFRDALLALSSSLAAGRTIELALKSAVQDLSMLYPNPETYIIKEMELINRKIEMNETIESSLEDLAKRAGIEDISNFTDIFMISKRSGANLVEVIRNAANIINDKIEIKQDIETLLSQRKLEQKILNIIPLGIMVFLYFTSPDYVEPIYTTFQGRTTMVFVLIMLAGAFFVSKKIVEIKV